jgi:23S rRNA G2069 N7-methylase RlmK/C1962 C5-methylase RlmI
VVILDPPKLAPNRQALAKATQRYRKLNSLAASLVAPGGLLVTCTCSGAMAQRGQFPEIAAQAVAAGGRHAALVGRHGPAGCHVTSPAYPEGNYLEVCVFGIH